MSEQTVSGVPTALSMAPVSSIGQLHPIWRLRLITGTIVAIYMMGAFYLWHDPMQRAINLYLFIVPFGYGHLIGAAWFGRAKMRAMYPKSLPPHLLTAFLWVGMFNLFALYQWSVGVFGQWIVILLQGFSCWHTVENDFGLKKAYDENLNLNPVPRSLGYHLAPIGITALIGIVGAASLPELQSIAEPSIMLGRVIACGVGLFFVCRNGTPNKLFGAFLIGMAFILPIQIGSESLIQFSDVFNALVSYHLVSWFVFFYDRSQKLPAPARRSMWKRILWVHTPAPVVCLVLWCVPIPALDTARQFVFSVAVYLFWSVAHVGQTFVARGIAPRAFRMSAEAAE